MKIATWNVERLKHRKLLGEITSACSRLYADILVLTEADERIRPDYQYCFRTPVPHDIILPHGKMPVRYLPTEHRISIYTNYKCVRQHDTFDKYTALCVELETGAGSLIVYGTIIGILGNRHPSFMEDLKAQTDDYKRLAATGNPLCVCGDFNCSFADGYYFTGDGRNLILRSFAENHIRLLTKSCASCIDHIAVSEHFLTGSEIRFEEWNLQKTMSDHKGILVSFT